MPVRERISAAVAATGDGVARLRHGLPMKKANVMEEPMIASSVHSLLDPPALRRLADPRRWQMVVNLPGFEGVQVKDSQNRAWRQRNSHAHPYPEMVIALEGSVTCSLAGIPRRCDPGTIILFAPGELHDDQYPPQAGPLRHLWFRIIQDRVFVTLVHVARGGDPVPQGYSQLPLVETGIDFWRLWGGCRETAFPAVRRLLLHAIIAGLIAGLSRRGAHEPSPRSLSRAVAAIRQHLEETGGRDASLNHLAALAGYSKHHFWRAFKAETGMTLHGFIDQCRVRKTVAWLKRGCSYKEIGERLGFGNATSFSRWCRRYRALLTTTLVEADG